MDSASILLNRFLKSVGFALQGIRQLLKTEQNARIHLFVTIAVITAGFLFCLTALEWCVVILCIGLVWAAEAFNTAIETITNHLFKEQHETARIIKDVSAGAVLICALVAAACGLIIFLPKVLMLF